MLTQDRDTTAAPVQASQPIPAGHGSIPRTRLQRFLRRRRFLVDPRLQLHLLAYSLSYVILCVLALGTALFAPLGVQLMTSELDSAEALQSAGQLLYIHGRFWIVGFLVLLCIAMHSILNSHRIAGPLFRLRRTLEQMRGGDFSRPLPTRHGDLLGTEIGELNRTVDVLRDQLTEVQRAYRDLDDAIQDEASAGRIEPHSRIAEKGRRLGETLAYFRCQR